MDSRFWVISYDIGDARRLRRVARLMERFGTRVQKSVFECCLAPDDHRTLEKELALLLESPPDTVRWYPLCGDCRGLARSEGGTEIIENRTYYIV